MFKGEQGQEAGLAVNLGGRPPPGDQALERFEITGIEATVNR